MADDVLVVEMRPLRGNPEDTTEPEPEWVPVGTLNPGDAIGSIAIRNAFNGRDIILFGFTGLRAAVLRSAGGLDYEADGGIGRVIDTAGVEVLAALGPGESYERNITLDRAPQTRFRVRWTRTGEAGE